MAERTKRRPGGSSPRRRKVVIPQRPQQGAVESHAWPPLGEADFSKVAALVYTLSQTEWWPASRLLGAQLKQLALLVRHAQKTVPFYRHRLGDASSAAQGVFSLEAFRAIPILTREEVQDAGDALLTTSLPKGHGPTGDMKTSGSSGQPVKVKRTALAQTINQATTCRYHQWFQRDLLGSSVSILVTNGPPGRKAGRGWAMGGLKGPSYIYSNAVPISQLYTWLLKDDPHYLQCHPSVLQEMLTLSGRGGKPKRLREVRSMGEILDPALRVLCRNKWGVPVRDNYSCEEGGILALQCPDHEHFHVQSEKVFLEILDENGRACAAGDVGRVVITPLHDFATPLIRYELGDRAVAGGTCPCGRGLPVIRRIIGRERHPVVLPSGDRIFPVLDAEPLLLELRVRQYQLVQRSLEEIDLNLVVSRPLTEAEEMRIEAHLQANFGYPFKFRFVYVDGIPRAAGGKFQIFRSEIV